MAPVRLIAQCASAVLGLSGVALNALLIYTVVKSTERTSAPAFRTCIIVTAAHAVVMSLLHLLNMLSHDVHSSAALVLINGPVLWLGSEALTDVAFCLLVVCFVVGNNLMPAGYVLQYLVICRDTDVDKKRLAVIYGGCFLLNVPLFVVLAGIVPTSEFRAAYAQTAREALGVDGEAAIAIYGGPFLGTELNGGKAMLIVIGGGIVVSFVITYLVIGTLGQRILSKMSSLTRLHQMSTRTLRMQRKFTNMIILQGVLPVVLFGCPVGLFFIAALLSADLALLSISISLLTPLGQPLQALLSLYCLRTNQRERKRTTSCAAWPATTAATTTGITIL